MAEPTLEQIAKREAEAISTANSWERMAAANVTYFETNLDYDGAVPPAVAAEIARDALREAGLHERANEVVTPKVNCQQ